MSSVFTIIICCLVNINVAYYNINFIDNTYTSKDFVEFNTLEKITNIIPTNPPLKSNYEYGYTAMICSNIYYTVFFAATNQFDKYSYSIDGIVAIDLNTQNQTKNVMYYKTSPNWQQIYGGLACDEKLNEFYGAMLITDKNYNYNLQINKLIFHNNNRTVEQIQLTEIKNVENNELFTVYNIDAINKIFYYSWWGYIGPYPRGPGVLYMVNLTNGDVHGPYSYPLIKYDIVHNLYYQPYMIFPPSSNGENGDNFNPNYFSGVLTDEGMMNFLWCNFTVNYNSNNTNITLINSCETIGNDTDSRWFESSEEVAQTFCNDGTGFINDITQLRQYNISHPIQPVQRYPITCCDTAGIACSITSIM